ncbi:MAG TPA: hypothetical protein VID47_13410 [Actinomycetota bacterium]
MPDSVDDLADRLYSLDPEEFTSERNAAARQLRADGDSEGSDRVKALKRPTAVAWAVNQLSRRSPKLVDELLDAGASLRSAQRAALSGSGTALREATQQRRAVVGRLVDEAQGVFRDAGRSPASHVDAIRSTLEAASTDEALGELVRAGRLTKEADAPAGFGDVSGFEVLLGGRSVPSKKADDDDATDRGGAEPEDGGSETPAARRVRARAEAKVSRAEDAVMAARRRAAESREHAKALAADVDRIERELATLRKRSERAAKDAENAAAKLEDAEGALSQAQSDLADGS